MRAMKPLIFLDIDGVLNNHISYESNGYCGIVDRCAFAFNLILKETDAEIVVSSAWRYMVHEGSMTLRGFENMLCTHGIDARGRIIGVTPTDEARFGWNRGDQIREWLNQHGGDRRYVVVDDLETVGIREAGHPFVVTDGDVGLTLEDAQEIIEVLKFA